MDDLIRKAMVSDALRCLTNRVRDIQDIPLRRCCQEILGQFVVKQAPASHKYHQAYRGGLVVHMSEVMELAYKWRRPDFDWDVVVAAIIWHDIGKIYTHETDKGGVIRKTVLRSTIGHPALSAMEFSRYAYQADDYYGTNVDKGLVHYVAHCILSHHGRTDWQCPILPQTKEAWLVHFCDYGSVRAGKEPVVLHPDEEEQD